MSWLVAFVVNPTQTMKTNFFRFTAAASLFLLMAFGFRADKNIVETAQAAGKFTTLLKAAQAAGLVETLSGPGPLTVFAPTDEAFAKVPKATLDGLLADPARLKQVLLYHVVAGNVKAADVVKLKSAKTVNGQEAKITVSNGKVMIDNANVVTTDIEASNGVIHVIDAVILPKM